MTESREEMTRKIRGKAKVKEDLGLQSRQDAPPRIRRVRADPRVPPLADHYLERQLPLLLEELRRSDPLLQPAMRAVTYQSNSAGIITKENANSEIPVPEITHDRKDHSLRRRRESNSKIGKVEPDAPTHLHHAPQEESSLECAANGRSTASARSAHRTAMFQHPEIGEVS